MDDEDFELPVYAEEGEEPPFENRIHDELIEGFSARGDRLHALDRLPSDRTVRAGERGAPEA